MDVVVMLALAGVVGAMLLTPLLRRSGAVPAWEDPPARGAADRKAADTLADLEFDHATGKVADDDYAALRADVASAAARPASADPAPVPAAADEVVVSLEAEIRAARRARRFCTGCGTMLPKAARFCPSCGAPVEGRV